MRVTAFWAGNFGFSTRDFPIARALLSIYLFFVIIVFSFVIIEIQCELINIIAIASWQVKRLLNSSKL
jgi:hypothetical protein